MDVQFAKVCAGLSDKVPGLNDVRFWRSVLRIWSLYVAEVRKDIPQVTVSFCSPFPVVLGHARTGRKRLDSPRDRPDEGSNTRFRCSN